MIPDIYISHTGTSQSQVLEQILAVLVKAEMVTVSGAIGDRINAIVAERERLPNPLTGDTV